MEKPSCEVCREIKARKGLEPPCETCQVIPLEETNEVADIFFLCQDQLLLSWDGKIIGLRIEALKAVMDILEVPNKKKCLTRVLKMFRYFQDETNKKREK